MKSLLRPRLVIYLLHGQICTSWVMRTLEFCRMHGLVKDLNVNVYQPAAEGAGIVY